LLGWLVYHVRALENPLEGFDLNAYNGLFFLWLGALVFLPGRLRGRLSWISVTALLTGIALITVHAFEEHLTNSPAWLPVISSSGLVTSVAATERNLIPKPSVHLPSPFVLPPTRPYFSAFP
jgi:hypothetical protein